MKEKETLKKEFKLPPDVPAEPMLSKEQMRELNINDKIGFTVFVCIGIGSICLILIHLI